MPAITIHITPGNTAHTADRAPRFGHMWFELNDGSTNLNNVASFGWEALAPTVNADSNAADIADPRGHVVRTASADRQARSYSSSLTISQVQYEKMKSFAADPLRHGFAPGWDTMSNSDIDYTWRTLQEGGLNPPDLEGKVWPLDTITLSSRAAEPHIASWRNPDNVAFVQALFEQSKNLLTANWKIAQQVRQQNQQPWNGQSALYDQLIAPLHHGALAFDLDGDGLETRNDFTRVYFDNDSNGIKTATSWILPDDGLLVMDRNGNGVIDNGSELFGTGTALSDGSLARNGFEALAPQDSNGDGIINRNDANWSMLNIWRDDNQDGISQSDELSSLAQRNIASINLNDRSSIQLTGNDNSIAAASHYTKSYGNAYTVADVRLRQSLFFRAFAEPLTIPAEIATLPDAAGSGKVRNLRQAATQSATLQQTLATYAAADTRQQQQALLDQLLSDWAATAGMQQTVQERLGSRYDIIWSTIDGNDVSEGSTGAAQVAAWERRLLILDAFQGQHLLDIQPHAPANSLTPVHVYEHDTDPEVIYINLSTQQTTALNQAYIALQESVYATLLMQTRFKSVFDRIQTTIDNHGVQIDMRTVEQYFNAAIAADKIAGLSALIEFYQYASIPPGSTGWRADSLLADHLQRCGDTPEELQLLADFDVAATRHNTSRQHIFDNAHGTESSASNDHVLLDPGLGMDIDLQRDVPHDIVPFAEILAAGLPTVRRSGDDLVVEYGSNNSTTIKDVFAATDDQTDDFLIAINSAMNTELLPEVDAVVLEPARLAVDSHALPLIRHANILFAGPGNDTIGGTDGNDCLHGQDGDDFLFGNDGRDVLNGGSGNNLLIGGIGDDEINSSGTDTIGFNRHDGADTVRLSATANATVSLGGGIAYGDLMFEKSADNLVLNLGMNDSMTFQHWYDVNQQRGVASLQMMTEGSGDYDETSASTLRNHKIVHFDFAKLVAQFDAAQATDPGTSRWPLSSGLQQALHGSSDIASAALGGERAYRYGRSGQVILPASQQATPIVSPQLSATASTGLTLTTL